MVARLALVLALVVVTHAGPIVLQTEENRCSTRCVDSSKFQYQPGTTYQFQYGALTQTTVDGAAEDRAELNIQTTAEFQILSKCDVALVLRNTQINDAEGTADFRDNLERFPLRFAFQDGVVEELCPEPEESTWALNIKRGILSMFQNSMKSLEADQSVQENDVNGRCTAEYSVSKKGWYSTTVKKSKDLLACVGRQGYRSAVAAIPYSTSSNIQSLPLVKSTHECEQEVDSGKTLKSATCKESHVFRPFSRENSGAATIVRQRLTSSGRRAGVAVQAAPVARRAGLAFDHVTRTEEGLETRAAVLTKMTELCQTTKADLRPHTPRLFSELVHVIKTLDVTAIKDMLTQIQQDDFCPENSQRTKSFFLDALPMVQTGAAIQVMKELLLTKEVTGVKATGWLTSLAFIQVPDREMLQAAKGLLESADLGEKALLPVSTLINNYCQGRPRCGDDNDVTALIAIMEGSLGSGCYVTDKNIDKVLLNLRAIGNAGHAERVVPILNKCLKRSTNAVEVRVIALEAFRRLPCTASRGEALTAFTNAQEDSEVRIAAYLALMTCPSETVLTAVQSVLATEDVSQLTSFVWSHLTNLKETSSPHKQAVRALLEGQDLQAPQSASLKSSQNLEGSFFLERLNAGATVESNVIWSQDAFPRSLTLNLTVDLFGSSVNLLEMGGRMEGLNYLLESYLGPYGLFGDTPTKNIKTDKLNEVRGALYLRMFGNEMAYNRWQGANAKGGNSFNFLDLVISLAEKQTYRASQSLVFLDSSLTLATAAGLPLRLAVNGTASLDLQVEGKADFRKVAASPRTLLIDGIVRPSGAVEIASTMTVEAGPTKSGLRMVSTLHSSTFLQGRLELQRGKVLKAELDMPQDKMEIVNVKSSFFIVTGRQEREQRMVTDNRRTLRACSSPRLAQITGLELCGELSYPNASQKVDGPYFPLTGPVGASLVLQKTDAHTGYNFLAALLDSKSSTQAQMSFSTPGGQVDRTLSFDVVLKKPQQKIDFTMGSPWKKMTMSGTLMDTSSIKGVKGSVTVDEGDEFAVTAQVERSDKESTVTFTPLIEIRRPQTKPISLTGSLVKNALTTADLTLTLAGVKDDVIVLKTSLMNSAKEKSAVGSLKLDDKTQYSADFKVQHDKDYSPKAPFQVTPTFSLRTPSGEVASLQASVEYRHDKSVKSDLTLNIPALLGKPLTTKADLKKYFKGDHSKFSCNLMVSSKLLTSKVTGYIDSKKGGTVNNRLMVEYNVQGLGKDKLTLSTKVNDRSTKSLLKYSFNANVESKFYPDYNAMIQGNVNHNKKHVQADLDFRYGANFKDANKHLALSTEINQKKAAEGVSLDYAATAVYLPLGLDLEVKGSHEHEDMSLNSQVSVRYAEGNTVQASLVLKNSSKDQTKISGDLTLTYPGKHIAISSDLTQKKRDYSHVLDIRVDNKKSSIETTYLNPEPDSFKVVSDISLHSFTPVKLSGGLNFQPNTLKAFAKAESEKKTYEISGSHKWSEKSGGKWSLDIEHPSRKVSVDADVSLSRDRYDGKVDARWNVGRNDDERLLLKSGATVKSIKNFDATATLTYPAVSLNLGANLRHKLTDSEALSHADFSWGSKQEIAVDLSFQGSKDAVVAKASLTTPFLDYRKQTIDVNYSRDPKAHKLTTDLGWSRGQKMSASAELKMPASLSNLDVSMRASTPFSGLRTLEASLNHRLEPQLITALSGSLEQRRASLSLNVPEWTVTVDRRAIEALLDFDSNLSGWEKAQARLNHRDDLRQVKSTGSLALNDQRYDYQVDGSGVVQGWQAQTSGMLKVTSPDLTFSSNWQHRHTAADVRSTLSGSWGNGKQVQLEITTDHGDFPSKVIATASLKTPWRQASNLELSLSHDCGSGSAKSRIQVTKNRENLATADATYSRTSGSLDAALSLTSSLTESMSTKANARYSGYPLTGHAELNLGSSVSLSADGDLTLALPTLDASVRLASSLSSQRSVTVKVNNKKENGQWLTTGSVETGDNQEIKATSAITLSYPTVARFTLSTPFSTMKTLEAGLEASGSYSDFTGKTDLTILPDVGRYSSEINVAMNNGLTGKLRVDTPLNSLPYAQLTVSANPGSGRAALEYGPRKIISMEAAYRLVNPVSLTARLTSPFQGYEEMNAAFSHNQQADWSILTHAEVSYNSYNKIETDVKIDWSRDLDANLMVRTPFEPYQASSVILRHSGGMDDFSSRGELNVANKNLVGEVAFKSGYTTSGTLKLSTPFPGYEKIKASFNKRGRLSDFRSEASMEVNGQKMEGSVKHLLTHSKVKTDITLTSPFSRDLVFSLEHHGKPSNFQNKLTGRYGSDYVINIQNNVNVQDTPMMAVSQVSYSLKSIGSKDIKLTFNHDGTLDDLSTRVGLKLDEQEISLSSTYKSDLARSGSLTFSSPFSGFEGIRASFSQEGNLDNFRTSASLDCNSGKHAEISLNSRVSFSEVKVDFALKTPLTNDFQVTLDHSGSWKSFTSKLTGSSGTVYSIASDSTFRLEDDLFLSSSLTYQMPQSARSFSLKLDHQGTVSNMKTNLELNADDKIIVVKSAVKNGFTSRATFSLQTPFSGWEKTEATLNKRGNMNNFQASADMTYGSNKKMDATVQFVAENNGIKSSLRVKTPVFDSIAITLSHDGTLMDFSNNFSASLGQQYKLNTATSYHFIEDILASASMSYAIPNSQHQFNLAYEQQGDLSDLKTRLFGNMDQETIEMTCSFQNSDAIVGSMAFKAPVKYLHNAGLTFRHSGDISAFSCNGEIFNEHGKMEGKVTMTQRGLEDVNALAELKTPFPNYEVQRVSFSTKGPLTNLRSNAQADIAGFSAQADAVFSHDKTTEGNFGLSSATNSFPSMKVTFNRQGDLNDLKVNGDLTYDSESVLSGILNHRQTPGYFSSSVTINNVYTEPLMLSLQRDQNSAQLSTSFGDDYSLKTSAEVKSSGNKAEVVTNVQYVLAGVSDSASLNLNKEGTLQNLKLSAVAKRGTNEYRAESSLKTSGAINFSAMITSPVTACRRLGATLTHMQSPQRLDSQAKVWLNDKEVNTAVKMNIADSLTGDIYITTPFYGFEDIGFGLKLTPTGNSFVGDANARINNDKASMFVSFNNANPLKGELIITTPVDGYKTVGASFQHSGDLENFQSQAKANLNEKEMLFTAKLNTDFDLHGEVLLTTPIASFHKIGMIVHHEGSSADFTSEATAVINDQETRAKMVFKNLETLEGDIIISTPSVFMRNLGASLRHSGSWKDFQSEAILVLNTDETKATATFKNADVVQGALTLTTPLNGYRNLGASFMHSFSDKITSEASITYKDGQTVIVKGNGVLRGLKELNGFVELRTPFYGFETTKVEIVHRFTDRMLSTSGIVQCGGSQKIQGQMKIIYLPLLDMQMKLQTPFYGYETMSASAKWQQGEKKHDVEGSVKLGHKTLLSLDSMMDYSSSPVTANLLLVTPIKNWEQTEMSLSHTGQGNNFRSSAVFKSPLTDSVQAEASLQYSSPLDLDVKASVNSRLPDMEELRLSLQNSDDDQQYKSHFELGWKPNSKIILDGTCKVENSWSNKKVVSDLTLSTPFDILKSTSLRLQHGSERSTYSEQLAFTYNGETLVDGGLELASDPRQATLTITKPRPMVLSTKDTSSGQQRKAGEVLVNWNRNEPQSNIRVTAVYNDVSNDADIGKDLTVRVLHPQRTVSVFGSLIRNSDVLNSRGELNWDESRGQVMGYELNIKGQREGSLKILSPTRSLLWRGAYSDSRNTNVLDAAFLWDADSNTDKQVAVKAVVEPGQANNKAGITVKMPSINKEFQIGSELTMNQGRTVFGSKTEVSYSTDGRKKLVLTSRLDDLSRGSGHNYSLALGLAHPYTDLDVQLRSHVGLDDSRLTAGLGLNYLTARRQMKTVTLRGEIDKLKKEINLLMDTPVKKIEMNGQLDTQAPYKLRLRNVYDDTKIITSALEINPESKQFRFSTNYDLDRPEAILHVTGGYTNESLLALETYMDPNPRGTDTRAALQLTAPRVLLTSLTWRPQILSDFQTFAIQKLTTQAGRLNQALDDVSGSVREEMAAKYRAVTSTFREEAQPLLALLDAEMAAVGKELDTVRRELQFLNSGSSQSAIYSVFAETTLIYRRFHADSVQTLQGLLDSLEKVDVRTLYRENVHSYVTELKSGINAAVGDLTAQVAQLDEKLQAVSDLYNKQVDQIRAAINENLKNLRESPIAIRLSNMVPDIDSLVDSSYNTISSVTLPERYSNVIASSVDYVRNSTVYDYMKGVADVGEEVKQQGLWAYRYWEVEKNVKETIKRAFKLLKQLVAEEVEAYRHKLDYLADTKVVTYLPDQGQISAQLVLPFELEDLQTTPDVTAYVDRVSDVFDVYLPDPETVSDLVQQYTPDRQTFLDLYNKYLAKYISPKASNSTKAATNPETAGPTLARPPEINRMVRAS